MRIDRLETPALIVEEKIFKQNAETMQKLLEGTTLSLRPHYKSHKCSAIARWQIKNGAKGMTCAKLSEAVDLADSGIEDILIANQIVDPRKIRRLADLAGDCRLTVCVDDPENVKALAQAARNAGNKIHCLIEYDIGMERCGVTEQEQVIQLAEQIGSEAGLQFDGIQAYAGHISHMVDPIERKTKTDENAAKLRKLLALLENHGMKAETVSGGSTGTAQLKAAEGVYTELQAGSYLFMDATYRDVDTPFQNSLFLLSTVVSARPGLTVIDSGIKTCGVDQGMPAIVGGDTVKIVDSEEHFQLHGFSLPVRCGDRLRVIPGHCCSTINLHDRIYIVDDGYVVDRFQITGRGYGK
jgi:3-hydroxy-D-aspartate aldolase